MSHLPTYFRISRVPLNAVYSRRDILIARDGSTYPVCVFRTLRFNYFSYKGIVIRCLRGCFSLSVLGDMFYCALNS